MTDFAQHLIAARRSLMAFEHAAAMYAAGQPKLLEAATEHAADAVGHVAAVWQWCEAQHQPGEEG